MVEIITLGCRLNAYESEVMRDHAQKAGLENVIIINSCAVTAEAERQTRQEIRRAKKNNPNVKVIVTGCAAQVNPEDFAAMEEVDVVLGNDEKLNADSYANLLPPPVHRESSGGGQPRASDQTFMPHHEKIHVNDIMEVKDVAPHLVSAFEGQTRAFVQVQNGCNHRCTFCIIPYGRGNSRSVPAGDVVAQVRELARLGFKEVVLTGVDISSYGEDLPATPTLGNLVRRILKLVPELPRLRLSSIDAIEVDDELYQAFAEEPRLMPHLHLSLQAGDDMVLKRMKRRHLRADILEVCAKLRAVRPDMVFGADIIAGFPTETDDMFTNTLKIVSEADLLWLHVFPYSARKGTPAAKMPQVKSDIRKARAAQLRAAGEAQAHAFLHAQIGTRHTILMEQNNIGRTPHFAPVKMTGNYPAGTLVDVVISGVEGLILTATPTHNP